MRRLGWSQPLRLALLLAISAAPLQAAEPIDDLPRVMAWSAYNLGTTGYNQSVAIGKVLREHYGVTLRVLPGQNDISRLIPLLSGRVQFSANGVSAYFAQEGVFQFADPAWGPKPIRLVLSSLGDSNQGLAVAGDAEVRSFADLRGKRVPWVRAAPALNVSTEAYLACGGLSWDDVVRIEYPGYDAMWTGIVNGQIDAAFGTTVSGTTRRLEASPRGIHWPTVPHDDDRCWEAIRRIAPYIQPHVATRGAGISPQAPHEGGTYPYPLLIALESTDAAMVRAVATAIHRHYDEFKDADPGAIGWALDRQNLTWVIPYHQGAVEFFKAQGMWTEDAEAHNRLLIERQRLLAERWQSLQAGTGGISEEAWMKERTRVLESNGFDPVWR